MPSNSFIECYFKNLTTLLEVDLAPIKPLIKFQLTWSILWGGAGEGLVKPLIKLIEKNNFLTAWKFKIPTPLLEVEVGL